MSSLQCMLERGESRRMRAELEAQLVEEETDARVAAAVEARVAEVMASEAVQATLTARLQAERRVLEEQVRRPHHRGYDMP